jgi:hypothetical protein
MGNPFQSSTGVKSNSTGSSSQQGNVTSSGSQTTTPNEDPLFSMFRQSILPAISQQYADAQKPVYGDAQRAQVMNQANEAGAGAETAVSNNAARRGTLNAGSTDAANTAIQQGVTGANIAFSNQIPFLNDQAKFDKTQGLLGLATNFLGRAPLGSTSTSSGDTSTSSSGTQSQSGTGQNTATPSLMGDIGGIAGMLAGI